MAIASLDLIRAREATQQLLETLAVETYLFEVEPGAGEWRVTIECAAHDGWQTTSLHLDQAALLASADDAEAYRRVVRQWRARLSACRRQSV